jgi:predicted  nucleic acid-binding Zn-ribbon protein
LSGNGFKFLLDLVGLDQNIRSAQKKLISIETELQTANQEKEALFIKENQLKQQVHDLHKEVDLLELDMKALDVREVQKKKQLDTVHSLKEYNSYKLELDAIHQEQQTLEQEVMNAWNNLEQAQAIVRTYSQSLGNQVLLTEEKIAHYTQEKLVLAHTIASLISQRPTYEKNVPPEWLEKYMIMRTQVDDPVVPIIDDTCSVCFNAITNQDLLRISRGALMQCKGCYRLLYAPEKV